MQPIIVHCCEVMYFGYFNFRGELGFLNCDNICMCVVNKQFELLEFVCEGNGNAGVGSGGVWLW